MALNKWIMFLGLLALVYFFLAPYFGLGGSLVAVLALTAAVALTLDFIGIRAFPIRFNKKFLMILMVGSWLLVASMAGWGLGKFLPSPAAISAPEQVTDVSCADKVSAEIRGKAATLYLNAWDQESNTPYSSAVDLSTNCWVYKNGNSASDYVRTTSDTSDGTLTGFSVGDTIYIYCGGSSYYVDPLEGLCIDSETPNIDLNAHAIASESNLQMTLYDDTGSSTLTADTGGDCDYTMSQGAGSEDSIYAKLKVNVANKAYHFGGWAVATFYNISKVEPQHEEGVYTKVGTPQHLESVDIVTNSTNSKSITEDYVFYKIDRPILLHEWDSIKEQFVVEADDTNAPVGDCTASPDTLNGFAILAKDVTYSRGADGVVYFDAYTHDASESDVGLDETETSPAGKQTGVLVEVA